MLINNWPDFARITVETGDLDPMYDLIWRMRDKFGVQFAERFALHFFMFYDAGEAAKCAYSTDDDNFWYYVESGYATFRRGTERRHFRGENGLRAITYLRAKGTPEKVWNQLYHNSYSKLVDRVSTNFQGCQIGPYFMWKAMDLLDRGLGNPVKLTSIEALRYMPDEPKKCALSLWSTVNQALLNVVDVIKDLPAPGAPGKMCDLAEAETVLCMIKGFFLTKTHCIGDDVDEKHAQLKAYPDLCELLPPKQDWSKYERGALVTKTLPA